MNEMESVGSKKYLRVGIYLRLSNEDRDKANKEETSESIKNQRNMLIDYINRHPEFVLIDEYSDEDLSRAGTYRPEFERLIRDCENKTGIRYDELSNLVLDATNKKIKKFYDEEELENLNSEKVNARFQKKIKALEKGLTDIQNEISKTSNYLKNIYENKVNGVITPEQFKDLITNYNKEIFSKYHELAKLNRVIAQEFIDKIYIGKFNVEPKSRDIQIKWNF